MFLKGLMYGFCAPKDCNGYEIGNIVSDIIDKASDKITKYIKEGDVTVSCNESTQFDIWTYLGA